MSFLDRLVERQHTSKKHTIDADYESSPNMTSLFLNVPSTFTRKQSNATPERHDSDDDDLSSDLELSFASTVSLNSPPKEPVALTPESDYGVPMDISPAPPKFQPTKSATRPRAFTSATSGRVFGSDVSNNANHASSQRGPSGSTHSGSKRTQRSALPMEWLMASPLEDASTSNQDGTVSDVWLVSVARATHSGYSSSQHWNLLHLWTWIHPLPKRTTRPLHPL